MCTVVGYYYCICNISGVRVVKLTKYMKAKCIFTLCLTQSIRFKIARGHQRKVVDNHGISSLGQNNECWVEESNHN